MKIKVVEILKELQSDIGAPSPKIISDEHTVFLCYYYQKYNPDFNGTNIHVRNDNFLGVVVFTFYGYMQFKFGTPNDEAISGHPYYSYGLHPYSISIIENSDWIFSLDKQNAVHPNHTKELFKDLKHYIFFFHDTCFEIIFRDYKYENIDNLKQKDIMKKYIDFLN